MARLIGAAFGVVLMVLLECAAAQTLHVVGDSIGWTVPSNGAAAYASWTSGKQFVVNDTLLFNFATGEHDVLRVTKESFDACTASNAIGNVITTGPVNITLEAPGEHYYICTIANGGHCLGGQKLAINVSNTPGAASPPTATPTPPTPSSPSPSNTPPNCAPPPTPPRSDPAANSPTGSTATPPSPGSSSSKALASGVVSMIAIGMSLVF